MKTIIVKTQKEFDKIKLDFSGEIIIKDTKEKLSINRSFDNAEISVSGNATIEYVSGNATIESVSGNATIEYVSGNATIKSVYGNAIIKSVYDNATILLFGMACICFLYGAKKIVSKGVNLIRQIGTSKINIQISKTTNFIQIKELNISKNPTMNVYKKLYPVDEKGKSVIMYKAVHKSESGEYYSNYDPSFKYKIGEVKTENCSKEKDNSCSQGIHISHKVWAVNFGKVFDDMALLECEVNEKDIVVSKDCDGKVRASKIKVIREVPKSEWYD